LIRLTTNAADSPTMECPQVPPTKKELQPQSPKQMKSKTIKSIVAVALLAPGALFATTATTTPVGYTTLTLSPGLNFAGLGVHNPAVVSGTLESFTAGSPNRVTDDQIDLSAFLTGGTYILEINDGSGIIQEINSATGTSLNVAADLSGLTYPVNYTLRKAATLASVFGNSLAEIKVDIGAGTVGGADQIWVYNGSGYNQYYFDEFGGVDEIAGWYNVNTGSPVNAATVNLIYADSFIVSSASGKDVVIAGEVKTGDTELNFITGLNFVGVVAPTVTTLADAFGSNLAEVTAAGLAVGAGTVGGADQLWFFNGSGFTKIYFDEFGGVDEIAGWYNVDTAAPVSAATVLPQGYVISAASGGNVLSGVPSFYSGL
jgi:hypothetical protein